MGLLNKINTRNRYPVEINGNQVFVRSLKSSELKRMNALDGDRKAYFMFGMCLVDSEGRPEIAKTADEDDATFAARVEEAFDDADIDFETMGKISEAIGKIGKLDEETIRKN